MSFAGMFDISDFSHWFYISIKKNKASKLILAKFKNIKNQLPKPNDGLIDAYKEIIPALIKQKEDTSYFIKKELPEPLNI